MTIKVLIPNQLPVLETLARQCFTETFGHLYTPEDLAHHLQTTCSADYFADALGKGDTILAAEEAGELIGYAKYGHVGLPLKTSPHPNDREIHRLYVLASHHGKKLGAALMQAMLDDPEMQQAPAIYLGVWSENHKAQRFYAHYGLKHFDNYTYYVGKHADDEYIMRRINPNL